MNNDNIIQSLWNLCHILRGDGISYHAYISELTYLLFLKIAEENKSEHLLPKGYRWGNLVNYDGDDLLFFYQQMLTYLGGSATTAAVREIYAFPTTVFSHSVNLRAVVEGIAKIDWHSIKQDRMGDLYEGLLAKNSEDARSGAGQYFTPRPLVDSIVSLVQPKLAENIQDPAAGSGGFLIAADHFIRSNNTRKSYDYARPRYQGVEIERGTHRICLMNTFLHQMDADLIFGDALTEDARGLRPADVILANPPFGAKAGSARTARNELPFPTTNKQLAFLQHAVLGLKRRGRAALVMPDSVLFEDGMGRRIRHDLMERCNLHTILRLPTGIFYSQGVRTNVLFFTRGTTDEENTKAVWIYDLRTKMPSFGKRNPLTREHFKPFEKFFGNEPYGRTDRLDKDGHGRARCFDRKDIAKRGDNLDITWLDDGSREIAGIVPSPNDIAAEIAVNLRAALEEVDAVIESLDYEAAEPTEDAE